MIFINEWLPNPTGSDIKGEFIELWNNGSAPVDLGGWVLETSGKKKFKLSGLIHVNEYMFLPRSTTKLSLKNTDGAIFLYDAAGRLADHSVFEGSAPEGESFDRIAYNIYDSSSVYNTIQQFVWGKPTPGAKNDAVAGAGVADAVYPTGIPLNIARLDWLSVLGLAVLAGAIFVLILWYAMRHDEDISKLFFGRDETIRA